MPSEPGPVFILRKANGRPYTLTLDRLTEHIRAARELRRMAFLDKMKQAANVVPDLEFAAEKRADALIARGQELAKQMDTAFTKHETAADAQHDAFSQLDYAMQILGNGGPADGSNVGAAPAAQTVNPAATPYTDVNHKVGS